jgi:hypothetical protein
MARRNRRYRNNGMPGGFVALPKYMRESLAWRTLKPVPRTAFVELAGLYNGVNNGWLAMSARTLATAINVSRHCCQSPHGTHGTRVHRTD